MKKKTSRKSAADKSSSDKKYCCVSGVCVRLKPKEAPVCLEGGGFMVGACSDCKWHDRVRNGDNSPFVAL
jgi:hypothetical protein